MPQIRLNDCQFHYTDQGEGPPLLLLHGLGSSEQDWEYQIPALTEHYRVLCLDMRGHGGTDKTGKGYSIALFAKDCLAFIEAMDLHKPHIVGLSMGGMIAFQLATDAPDVPASLTIVNSAPEVIPRRPAEYWMAGKRLFFAHILPMPTIAKGLSKLLFPKPEQEQHRQTFTERWCANDRKSYLASLRAIVGWGVSNHLDRISCPVLVVSADRDYTPVELKREYVSRMGDARLEVIEDSRHATPVDQPEAFNDVLLGFLAQVDSNRAIPTIEPAEAGLSTH
ncbi:alpha/beta hydrolase [Halopseudomonas sp.]|uniref:alpha/beta fold hydrolase n=1 Tax=Halopseudomonas sp. TaxID=2901191 RepID=UPI00311E0844